MLHGQVSARKHAFISSRNAGRNFVPVAIETSEQNVSTVYESRVAFKQFGLRVPPRRRVLIVGDSPGLCAALARGLRHPELDVRTAEVAARGFAMLARESVDFVIAELCLSPSGGIDFLEVIKKIHPASSRVLITGDGDIAVIRDAIKRSDVSYFLGKPWDAQSLNDLVRNLLLFDEPVPARAVGLGSEFRARSVAEGLQGSSRKSSRKSGERIANRVGNAAIRMINTETLKLNDLARDLLGASATRNPASAERE